MNDIQYQEIIWGNNLGLYSKTNMNDEGGLAKEIVKRKDLITFKIFLNETTLYFSNHAKFEAIDECAEMQWLEPLKEIIDSSKPEYAGKRPCGYILMHATEAIKSIQDQKDAKKMILEKNEKDMYLFFISSEITVFTKNIIIEKIAKAKWKEILEKLSKEKPYYGNSYKSGYTPQGTMWYHTIEIAKQALGKI